MDVKILYLLPQAEALFAILLQLEIQVMNKNGKVKAKYTAGNSLLPDSFEGGKDKMKIGKCVVNLPSLRHIRK